MKIVGLYAALLGLLYVAISIRAIRLRRALRIPIGDSGHPEMLRAMRVHANFAEYVPIALILILLNELAGLPALAVHGLGVLLLAGRLLHAYGVSKTSEAYVFRIAGMAMTFAVILGSAILLLIEFVMQLVD